MSDREGNTLDIVRRTRITLNQRQSALARTCLCVGSGCTSDDSVVCWNLENGPGGSDQIVQRRQFDEDSFPCESSFQRCDTTTGESRNDKTNLPPLGTKISAVIRWPLTTDIGEEWTPLAWSVLLDHCTTRGTEGRTKMFSPNHTRFITNSVLKRPLLQWMVTQ